MKIPAKLESAYCTGLVRSLIMTSELKKIVTALEDAEITVVCFKGPTLAVMAYGDLAKREFSDLDIFIPRKQIGRALESLKEIGYSQAYGSESTSMIGEIEVALDNGNCAVDLHWEFIPKYFGRFEPDYASTMLVPLPGFEARTLSPEDLLVYLAADYARDGWHSLSMITDVAHLIKNQALNWDEVWQRAGACKLQRIVALAILLVSGILDAPAPEEVVEYCKRDAKAVALAEKVRNGLIKETLQPDSPRFHLQCMDSWSLKICYCLRRAFEPNQKDFDYVRFPKALWWLYFLVRPLRLTTLLFSR